jgi:hypothetical protein
MRSIPERHTDLLPVARRAVFEAYRDRSAWPWIQVRGNSMHPLIRAGSWLLVEFGAGPGIGNIAVVTLSGETVAHRVIQLRHSEGGLELITQGDMVAHRDPPLPASAVLGVVRAVGRTRGGWASTGCGGAAARLIAATSRLDGAAASRAAPILARVPPPAAAALRRAFRLPARIAAHSVAIIARYRVVDRIPSERR